MASFDSTEKHTGYSLPVVLMVVLLCVLSVILFVALSKILLAYECPPVTLPFDFIISIILLGSASMTHLSFHNITPVALPEYGAPSEDIVSDGMDFQTFLLVMCRGVGQIVFIAWGDGEMMGKTTIGK